MSPENSGYNPDKNFTFPQSTPEQQAELDEIAAQRLAELAEDDVDEYDSAAEMLAAQADMEDELAHGSDAELDDFIQTYGSQLGGTALNGAEEEFNLDKYPRDLYGDHEGRGYPL